MRRNVRFSFYIANILFYFLVTQTVIAQQLISYKPVLDTNAFSKWPSARSPVISNDGKYFLYTIRSGDRSRLVIKDIQNDRMVEEYDASGAAITQDSRKVVFIKSKKELRLVTLGTYAIETIPNVSSFKLVRQLKKRSKDAIAELLTYHLNTPKRELVVQSLKTGNKQVFPGVISYLFDSSGNTLFLNTQLKEGNATVQSLKYINLIDVNVIDSDVIWEGTEASSLTFDNKNDQFAFIAKGRTRNDTIPSLWYYKIGRNRAIALIDNQVADTGYLWVNSVVAFSNDGRRVFLTIKERTHTFTTKPDAVSVDIWSYNDPKLQSQQLVEISSSDSQLTEGSDSQSGYAAVVDIDSRRVTRLQQEHEEIRVFADRGMGDMVVIEKRQGGDPYEWNWNSASKPSFYLMSARTGRRTKLSITYPYTLSSTGKYLIGTDSFIPYSSNNLLSYNIETGQTHNITESLNIPVDESTVFGWSVFKHRDLRVVTWLEEDSAIIVSDKYDIWQIDPEARKPPVNLTRGYGRKNNIVLRTSGTQDLYRGSIRDGQQVLLSAVNLTTQHRGFYRLTVGRNSDPELLTMGPYSYGELFDVRSPLKARDTDTYIVKRESAAESPNYFWTSNFKQFEPLTKVYPERAYNWMRSEILTFKMLDGRMSQGALYKPEDFDPRKRYPVILHYYEKKSDQVNVYHRPEAMSDEINIPWFVSRGYVVFTPDIHYGVGNTGQSAYNAVTGAAQYLATLPWIDAKHMGIQGHSFGGYETNYIVTQTNVFAAAASSAGVSNLVSAYGSVMLSSGVPYYKGAIESGQSRIGATLWQRPDLYIENSPIFQADKVITPLLMMHNKNDGVVDFAQGVEFFTALRRLGKKVWMLQYDGEAHSLGSAKAKGDYTIRLTQFFDHYLKGALAPTWMTRGIPAAMKGVDNGVTLDLSVKTPDMSSLLVDKELQ